MYLKSGSSLANCVNGYRDEGVDADDNLSNMFRNELNVTVSWRV